MTMNNTSILLSAAVAATTALASTAPASAADLWTSQAPGTVEVVPANFAKKKFFGSGFKKKKYKSKFFFGPSVKFKKKKFFF